MGKESLARQPVVLTGAQAAAIGLGFEAFTATEPFQCHACAILPTHTHLVLSRPTYRIEQAANLLKGAATRSLVRRNLWSQDQGTPWARRQWAVYLCTPGDVDGAVRYVENNPAKDGLPAQRWRFVVPFSGSPERARACRK